jgi:hypothetical protein
MPIEYANVEWALFPKTIYYTRVSDGLKLSTSGVSLQATKQAAGRVDSTQEDIAKMWQKASIHKGGPLVGNHFVPFGQSGDMGDSITTQIIHHQNAMLKATKQRVLTNLNDIDAIIEMETPETATFGLVYSQGSIYVLQGRRRSADFQRHWGYNNWRHISLPIQ